MTAKKKQVEAMLRITQIRSRIGNQERVVRVLTDGLGLGRIGASVELPDNPCTRGMVAKVRHMVRVEELAAATARKAADEGAAGSARQGAAGGSDDVTATKRQRRAATPDAAATEE